MFAHDLRHSQIKYLSNSVDLNRKDRAKRYHKSSIFNRQYSIPACPGWDLVLQPEIAVCYLTNRLMCGVSRLAASIIHSPVSFPN